MRALLAAALALLWAEIAAAQTCRTIRHDGNRYAVCEVDMTTADLRLFLYGENGLPIAHFPALAARLAEQGLELVFAMNAGMYHADRSPVGHYVEDGQEAMRVISGPGPGNFGLVPNGVLCLRPGRADVIETQDFLRRRPDCNYATQSGPMLVIDGQFHPRFLPDSTSVHIRNGVGTSADGKRAVFAISANAVNFHSFAALFRDGLGLPNALFLDGSISRLYAPELGRNDLGFPLGPMVGLVRPAAQ